MSEVQNFSVPAQDKAGAQTLPSAPKAVSKPVHKPASKAAKASGKWVYKRSKNWEYRREYKGQDLSGSGFPSAAAARKELTARVAAIDRGAKPYGMGAGKTSVAQALQDYALARLPYMKGASQEARRINNYLRAAGLRLLQVNACETPANGQEQKKTGRGKRFDVTLVPHTSERVIPNGLHEHRRALMTQSADTDRCRAVLANKPMNTVTRNELQGLVNTMQKENHAPATIALERSLLRVLFNHAYTQWNWSELMDNPATRLKMPMVNNARDRVMSVDEQALLEDALAQCRNKFVAPVLTLLRETAMRASEPLEHATWGDVDWERKVLKLKDSKTDAREVPLSPVALDALRELGPAELDEPLVKITYEALKGAWKDACVRAGVQNLRIHDLRHTAATRLALQCGNVFLVQALTGHSCMASLERYINVKADDVVQFLHSPTPAAPQPDRADVPVTQPSVPEPFHASDFCDAHAQNPVGQWLPPRGVQAVQGNVVRVGFRKAA